ncbi:DNA topoisomerase IV subunit B, partial [Listeria booriae]|nr:DNA topoisomerase IV subunit B [Listeria booriae]
YNYETLSERLRESAFLLKGMLIQLIDERVGMEESFHFEEGVKNFVEYINEGKDVLHPVASFEGENATIEVEMAFQFNDGYSENILSFVNNVRTRGAGSHESGMKAAMTRIFNDYARRVNLLKEKDKNLEGSDIREGLSAVLSIRVPEKILQFEGQTKEKLGTQEARQAVDAVVTEHLAYFLAENPETSSLLVKK